MSSDFIKLTGAGVEGGGIVYVNAYRLNAVVYDDMNDATMIVFNVAGQKAWVTETPEEVVAMIDQVVNGDAIGSVKLNRPSFPGMDKP